jgi:predicted DCC family thiol-disulfide oxidoreductase YuxK
MISPELLNSDASCMRFVSTAKARLFYCFLFIRMARRISANVAIVNTCKYLSRPWRFEVWTSISAAAVKLAQT